jgi:hypothetical protein
MTDYQITSNDYDVLQDVERELTNALGAVQVLAESLSKPADNNPEAPACWFILDGLGKQHYELGQIIENVMEGARKEQPGPRVVK